MPLAAPDGSCHRRSRRPTLARAVGQVFAYGALALSLVAGTSGCSFNLPARSVCATGTCSDSDQGTNPDLLPNLNDPGAAGAYKVAITSLANTSQLGLAAGTLYLPSDDGTTLSSKLSNYPLVLLAPAQHLSDPTQLQPYAQRLASHGIIVVQYRPTDETNQLAYRMSGLQLIADLVNTMEPAVGAHVDANHVGLAGYDLGAEMSVAIEAMYAATVGLFLIDPKVVGASDTSVQIDGLAAMGQVKLMGNPPAPVAILGEDVSKNGMLGSPPCTNPTQNYDAFYNASTVSAIEIDFPTAAHGDFVLAYPDATCGGGTMSTTITQNLAVKYMSAYFQWTLLGQTAAMDYLSGQNFMTDMQQYSLVRHAK